MYGVEPVLVETGWVRLWWYGLAYAVGLLTVDLWVWLRRERLGYEPGDVVLFSVLFAAGVLLGGRIFDVALYEWFYYEDHVRQIPRLWQGGMATHGVLLGGVAGTLLFCRLRGRSFLAVADEVVLPGAVLMALGRLGNHVNGEVYGSITSVLWAMEFPYAEGCRHPVALYDGLKNLLLVPILLGVRSLGLRRNGYLPKGLMLGHFVTWYGLLRLFVDVSREYDSYWLGIGRGQYFNLFMAAAGLCVVLAARRRSKSEAWMVRRGSRTRAPVFWGERVAFYVLVALCLTIPSGWPSRSPRDSRSGGMRRPQRLRYAAAHEGALTRRDPPSASGARWPP